MNNQIDLLVVYCVSYKAVKNISEVKNYPQMKSHFFHKNFVPLINENQSVKFMFLTDWWLKKSKHKFEEFSSLAQAQNIDLKNVKDILFALLGTTTVWKSDSLTKLLDTVQGKIYKFEDKDIRLFADERIKTIGHFETKKDAPNYYSAGFCVATDFFAPNQDWSSSTLKIHIDHNLDGRENIFPDIKNALYKIKKSIKKYREWDDIEVYYHDTLCEIEDIGHNDYNFIPLKNLSELYGSCNIAFLSHKETMGQYPLEMMSCGVPVIGKPNHVQWSEPEIINIHNLDVDTFLKKENLKRLSIKNNHLISKYSFETFAQNVYQYIFNQR